MNLVEWKLKDKGKNIDYRLSVSTHIDNKCKRVDIEINSEKWLSIKVDPKGDLVILFNDAAKNPLLNPHKFESLTEIKLQKQDHPIYSNVGSNNDLPVYQIKEIKGVVEHLTFHPETNEVNKEDQELHLYINEDEKSKPTGKIKSYSLSKNKNSTNLIFYLYVSNGVLTGDKIKENSTIIAIGNYIDKLNEVAIQMNLSGNSSSVNIEQSPSPCSPVRITILNENTYLFVKNNMPSIEIMSNSNELFYQKSDGYNLSYLKFCYNGCVKNNYNGFLILGNPKYAVENSESLYISYLN